MTPASPGRGRRALALTAALLAALLACSDSGEAPAPRRVTPEQRTPEPAPQETPSQPPAAAEPAAEAGGGDAARGAKHYAMLCASCHGARGDGDGPVAASLDPKPAKHSDAAIMNALSDEQIFLVIKKGGPALGKSPLMAAWGGTLSDAQIRDVVAFVRSLSN